MRRRSGVAQGVQIDMAAAEFECTGYFTVDGRAPDAWALLSGLYPCRDSHVRIHANFDHHRDGALALLGLGGNPESLQNADVQAALQDWDAEAFETAAAEARLASTLGLGLIRNLEIRGYAGKYGADQANAASMP